MNILKKPFLYLLLFISCHLITLGQEKPSQLNDEQFSTFYQQRVSLFRTLPQVENSIIFLGNSITNGAEWSEIFQNPKVLNRGISGDISAGVLNRLDEITKRKPQKVFLLIGINDLAKGIRPDSILKNIFLTADIVHKDSPETQLYIQSIFPVSNAYNLFGAHTNKSKSIIYINKALAQNAQNHHYTFINVHQYLTQANGKLDSSLSNDGLHLKGNAYMVWKNVVQPYIDENNNELSLIPYPNKVNISHQKIDIHSFTNISTDAHFLSEATYLQTALSKVHQLVLSNQTKDKSIVLVKDAKIAEAEGYQLNVSQNNITIKASTAAGAFYGIQTLLQLALHNPQIPLCDIEDAPAFSWRGYMIDVGRNYQSIATIKQQIDKMAFYKMNVFHFHPTEDVAWRLAIKKYPQLTKASTMTRQKGKFYTEAEIKDLMAYCKARHILFIPEIDMPGHSAAFERAFGFGMQSPKGLQTVKDIINEVLQTYRFKYLHIGGDEVHIKDKNFLPEVIKLIEQKGTKVIGWEPGGNLKANTLRQLWMEKDLRNMPNYTLIDSKHAYINHFDPEESVITLFQRQFLESDRGNAFKLGAELCLWHDRNISEEKDLFEMNAVYPSIMTFAERSWKGGGLPKMTAHIPMNKPEWVNAFRHFERRLMQHKQAYFKSLPFNYVQQSQIYWKLIGPYDNKGDLEKSFAPEEKTFNFEQAQNTQMVNGASIILRHFWTNVIDACLPSPKENTTWYAYTKFWSDKDTIKKAWIGAYDISRSVPSSSFRASTWNNLNTEFYVNNQRIAAPKWTQIATGNLEIPFSNEGYSYRAPQEIQLKKGWNKIFIKLPVGKFESNSWYQPVKWQFTFVFVEENDNGPEASAGIYTP